MALRSMKVRTFKTLVGEFRQGKVVERTCKETQEIKDTRKDTYTVRRIFEILPGEEGVGMFRGTKPPSESLEATLFSKRQVEPGMGILTKFAMASVKSSIRAITRIVHLNLRNPVSYVRCAYDSLAYPISSIKFLAAIGKIVPPREDPAAKMPNASDLRF